MDILRDMPEPEGSSIPIEARRGTFEESYLKVDDSSVAILRPFTEPTNAIGTAISVNIATSGNRRAHLEAIYGKKLTREELSSGDSLLVYSFMTPRGTLIFTDIEDGFTALNKDSWNEIAARDKKSRLPRDPDVFFTILNHQFAGSPELTHWITQATGIINQLSPNIRDLAPVASHASPVVEVAFKEIQRQYLTAKNSFRTTMLGNQFFASNPGKELANGIFGVSSLFIPSEAINLPDVKQTGTSASTMGGFAVCRSLADIAISTTFPSAGVFLTDANAFFDLFVEQLKPMLKDKEYEAIRSRLYEKIDNIYAAYNQTGIKFALTEEESFSASVSSDMPLMTAGATDGAYFATRAHEGDPRALFLEAVKEIMEHPKNALARFTKPADDYLLYSISFN